MKKVKYLTFLLSLLSTVFLISCQKSVDNQKLYYNQNVISVSSPTQNLQSTDINSLGNGLLLYLPFSGNTNDYSGNGNNGTNNNAILTSDRFGKKNNAYKFGTNKNISILTPNDNLNLVNNFTISSWFKFDTLATNYNGSILLSKCWNEGSDGWVYGIWNPNHNTTSQIINFQAYNQFNTNTYPGALGIVSANNWYHFVATYNAQTQILKYFLNGSLISSINIVITPIANTRPISIGFQNDQYGTYVDYFRGTIDEIRIYNRILTQQEITYLATH